MAVITAKTAMELTTVDYGGRYLDPNNTLTFLDDAGYTSAQGNTYEDLLGINVLGDTNSRANWLGTGIVFDPATRVISAGTLTGFVATSMNAGTMGPEFLAVEGFSTSAVAFYDMMASATAADDLVFARAIFAGADTFNLSPEADNVWAWTGNDTLHGNGGNDTLYGDAGDDWLDGGTRADRMLGGSGRDTYVVDHPGDVVIEAAGGGTDTVRSSIALVMPANVENLVLTGTLGIGATGNAGANVLVGNTGRNALSGGAGNDRLVGGLGNDTLDGNAGADTLEGGEGHDTYRVDNAGDVIIEPGFLTLEIETVVSSVSWSLANNAFLEHVTLIGSAPIDATGNGANNTLLGNDAANRLYGGDNIDVLAGGAGNDTLDGGAEADVMVGGTGNDTYYVDRGSDTTSELSTDPNEIDTVISSVSYGLSTNIERLALTGTAITLGGGNELANGITGSAGANGLGGAGGNDAILGRAGNDTLDGGSGNDRLDGGSGDDTLLGGFGLDVLTGGPGLDTFRFTNNVNGTPDRDTITDFTSADDRIEFENAAFTAIGPEGALAVAAFRLGTAALDASDRMVYDSATGALRYDADGSGGGAAILVAQLAPGTLLLLADLWVI